MEQAFKQALIAYKKDEVPVGAVIVKDDVIIARAHNQMNSLTDPTAHAELIAITMACNGLNTSILSDCLLYSTLEPCIMCSGAIVLSRMQSAIFPLKDDRFGGITSVCNTLDIEKMHRVSWRKINAFEADSKELLRKFFSKKRKINQMERWLSG